MDRLLLARHAQADGHDHADPALSAVGEEQAALLAHRLSAEPVVHLLSSPRRRARQTAAAIAQQLGREPEVGPFLDDRTPMPSAGHWDDYPEHRWDWLRETPETEQDEDGAALDAAWQRLTGMLDDAPGTLVVVTHAFVIGSFVASALSAPPSAWMLLPVGNATITELQRRTNGEIALTRFNDDAHL
ncbi:histidine phosphatase family protein [Microbacterium sp. NPDC057659]|uniref:histidine phosphatase family protein n=1 Tax=Microbacterium sp. NPDC057659 TaxID=3346198 RepID=UPI00366E188E